MGKIATKNLISFFALASPPFSPLFLPKNVFALNEFLDQNLSLNPYFLKAVFGSFLFWLLIHFSFKSPIIPLCSFISHKFHLDIYVTLAFKLILFLTVRFSFLPIPNLPFLHLGLFLGSIDFSF